MYPLRLSAPDRRLYTRALRAGGVDLTADPDVPGDGEDESTEGPKDGDTPTTPAADPGANPMRVVTANVQNSMSAAKREADFITVRDLGSIILFQEIREGTSQELLRRNLPATDWHILPAYVHTTDKIAVKKSLWDVEQAGYYFMSDKPPVMGRKRYCTVALVTSKTVTGLQFLVVNTHYVAYAWSAKKIADKETRKKLWNRHYNRQQALILDARSKGITVLGGGDFNRGGAGLNKFDASQVWLRQASLDHLYAVPATGGAGFTLQSSQSVALNSDHNALVAQILWTAGTNSVKSGYNWGGA